MAFLPVLALLAAHVSGCRTPLASSAALRIGTVRDAPPLICRQKGRWTGLEADLGRNLAARLGMKPVFIPLPAERLTDALLTGKVDMLMAGLTITDTRRLQMDFSLPYLVVGQAALIRSEDLLRYNTDLKIRSTRCRIGLLADSPAEELVDTYFSPAVRLVFARPAEGAGALEKQQIDIFMHDAPAVWWLAGQSKGRLIVAPPLFAREELAWGFRRSSNALREAANQVLAEWRQDGTLEAVLQRWLPVSR